MYKTRKDVDFYVRGTFAKFRPGPERDLRCLTIAKLYYNIHEYAKAEEYLQTYLNAKEDSDLAHKMLGFCAKNLKKYDKALSCFQRSLQLNPRQHELLVEVCQMLVAHDNLNAQNAKYWCEMAESVDLRDPSIFDLRMKINQSEEHTGTSLEELIHKEIRARPNDVNNRIRLLRNYLDQQKLNDAYQYAFDLEMEINENYRNSSEWYNVVWLVLNRYEQQKGIKKDWNYWLLLITCLERQVQLKLANSDAPASDAVNLLFRFDQYLFKFSEEFEKLSAGGDRLIITQFLEYSRGQLLLHGATVLLKRELMHNRNKWTETVRTALPLILLGYQHNKVPDERQQWLAHASKLHKKLSEYWLQESAFRCAQLGRTLLSCVLDDAGDKENDDNKQYNLLGHQTTGALWENCDDILSIIRETCVDSRWRQTLFPLLFTHSEHKMKIQSSYFIKAPIFQEPKYEWPTITAIENYEELAQQLNPQTLAQQVYLCVSNENLADVRLKFHTKLNFSVQNLNFCGVESLNQLDIESFLYATAIQAKRSLEVEREVYDNYNSGNRCAAAKPRMLPYAILPTPLCTEEQAKWWRSAYKVATNQSNEGTNMSELRMLLQYGIEAVRGSHSPKMDLIIVFKLGQLLVTRSQGLVKQVEKLALEERAQLLYKQGLLMLKKHQKSSLEPYEKYFKYAKSNMSIVERAINTAAEDAISFLGTRYFKKHLYEDFINELEGLQLPTATYMQAEAYRKLDEHNKTPRKSKSQYLERRNECLQQTQQLLQNDEDHPLSSLIAGEIKRFQQTLNSTTMSSSTASVSSVLPNNRHVRLSENFGQSPRDLHNNSSNYEDAEEDFYGENVNRSLRSDVNSVNVNVLQLLEKRFQSLEITVNKMAKTLCFIKDEYVDSVQTKLTAMGQDVTNVKDDIVEIKEALKKTRIASEAPSHDDGASQVLDDLYIIEDVLQQHAYSNTGGTQSSQTQTQQALNALNPTVQLQSGMYNGGALAAGAPFVPQTPLQQSAQTSQRYFTPNAGLPTTYQTPLFNPNASAALGYYSPQAQYMYAAQNAPNAAAVAAAAAVAQTNILAMRNSNYPLNLYPPTSPFADATAAAASGGLNFNMTAPPPPAAPQQQLLPTVSSMAANQLAQTQLLPSVSALSTSTPVVQSLVAQTSSAPFNNSSSITSQSTVALPTQTGGNASQFNKVANKQPVEKGLPANVVITSSDPLPKPPVSGNLTAQQPTLSVTIPPQHIKPSLVQVPEIGGAPAALKTPVGVTNNTNLVSNVSSSNANTSFQFGQSTFSFGGFGGNFSTSVSTTVTSTISVSAASVPSIALPNFSFKPQVAQAIAEKSKNDINVDDHDESHTSDVNKSFGGDSEPEYDPRPDFKPIIPLPDEVEVKTGEEDEVISFCYRAKLYRHVDNEWKERGVGEIKILKNKEGYSRILMRRDQTHKICANHKIVHEMKISQSEKETKSCLWGANDYADEELRVEKFLVRFKLPETAKEFMKIFNEARDAAEKLDEKASEKTGKEETPAAKPFALSKSAANVNFTTSTPSHASKSADTTGAARLQIATSKANTTPNANANANVAVAAPKSLFNNLVSGNKSEQSSNANESVKSVTNPSPFANFSFGGFSTADNVAAVSPFAKAFANTSTTSTIGSGGGGGGGGGGDGIFNKIGTGDLSALSYATPFSTPTAVKGGDTTTTSTANETTTFNKSGTSDAEDDYVPTAQFKPVIPLPELIEVSTGEENEIILFEHRAKLLRFDKETGEWKERGLGNMKILQSKDDVNQVRLLMRREQVHKLCCNQRLLKETKFTYLKNNKTAISWAGQDYSEHELNTELLCVRFKLPEVCKQFYDAVVKAQAKLSDECADSVDNSDNTDKTNSSEEEELEDEQELHQVQEKEQKADKPVKGFGDAFKPKAGSWSCQDCYTNNGADEFYCMACEAPRDHTVPKKEPAAPKAFDLTTNTKFTFGFGGAGGGATPAQQAAALATSQTGGFVFGGTQQTTTTATAAGKSDKMSGFGDRFKAKEGSWNCNACYLSNNEDTFYCSACEEPKDNTVPPNQKSLQKSGPPSVLSLNPTAPSKFNFGFAAPAANQKSTINTANVTSAAFSFGNIPATAGGSGGNATQNINNLFIKNEAQPTQSQSFTFTPPTATSTTLGTTPSTVVPIIGSSTFSFTMPGSKLGGGGSGANDAFTLDKEKFNFTLKPKSPGRAPHNKSDAADDDDELVEEESNAVFTPVIPLPDKIDVKTGEEDEDILYVHRAKLYRLIDNEWKERGLGDIKILRHKDTKKLRVVMRREQVLKICLNHVLNADVSYKPKDDKTWLFVVHDFSEGENVLERFSLRFKNAEIAKGFYTAVERALDGTAEPIEIKEIDVTTEQKPIISTKISVEQQNLADKLSLPHKFYEEVATPCAGCRGCNPDEFKFSTPKKTISDADETTTEAVELELPKLKLSEKSKTQLSSDPKLLGGNATFGIDQSKNDTVFSGFGSVKNAFSFTAAANNLDQENNKDKQTFGAKGGFLFGGIGATDKKPVFGNTSSMFGGAKPATGGDGGNGGNSIFNTSTSTGSSGGSIFGSNTAGTNSGSIFSGANTTTTGASIFGGGGDVTKTTTAGSIFGGGTATTDTTTMGGSIFGGDVTKPTTGSVFGSGIPTATPNTGSIFGGGLIGKNKGGSIFGAGLTKTETTTGGSIFGTGLNKTETTTEGSIFGTGLNKTETTTGGSIFGTGLNKTETTTGGSIFGTGLNKTETTTESSILVSGLNKTVTTTAGSILSDGLGNTETSTAGSIFSGGVTKAEAEAAASIYGVGSASTETTTASPFDGTTTTAPNTNDSNFSATTTDTPLNTSTPALKTPETSGIQKLANVNPSNTGSIFGGPLDFGSRPVFGNSSSKFSSVSSTTGGGDSGVAGDKTNKNTPKEDDTIKQPNEKEKPKVNAPNFSESTSKSVDFASLVAKDASGFADLAAKAANTDDFASLAAKAGGGDATNTFNKAPVAGNAAFVGLTHKDAFQSFKNKSLNNDSTSGDNANATGDDNDENYDPHYDPIIPLPKEIVVSTGEEDEIKLFGERGTLYRFNPETKEWKERGVGEIKILLHPEKRTYRMVMRREQIHKLVLNHGISKDFLLSNMKNNPKAFMWGAWNYAESIEGELERLAVRFKKQEQADLFSGYVEKAIEEAKEQSN